VTAADRDPHSDIGADPGSDSDIGGDVDADPNPDAAGLGAAGDFGVDALDRIEFLARSPVRVRLLAAIADGDGLTKNELRDRLDASRTTVGRNLEALRDQGLVTKGNCEYTLTRAGEIVTGDVLDLAGTIEIARELEPFLEWVPNGALDIDLRHFADATVLAPEPGDPWSMINHHVQVIRRTEYDRNVLNVIGLHGYETGYGKDRRGVRAYGVSGDPRDAKHRSLRDPRLRRSDPLIDQYSRRDSTTRRDRLRRSATRAARIRR
jgi:DNA-binding transcriptional ArsR family regulator